MTEFNNAKCDELIAQNKWSEAAEFLKSSFPNTQSQNLENVVKFVRCEYLVEPKQIFLIEILRVLRNSSTTPNTRVIFENSDFLTEIVRIFQKLNDLDSSELVTKILLQFLINAIVTNPRISSTISKYLYNEILECFRKKRNKYEVLALLYNIHLQDKSQKFQQSFHKNLLESFDESCEYSEFLVELFIYDEDFWTFYGNFETFERIIVLEILKKSWLDRNLQQIPDISLEILSKTFRNSMEIIFQTVNASDESLEPYEVSIVLDILGCLCSDEKYLGLLQEDKELIIRSGVVLINLHRLGKQCNNYFTSVQKLSELQEPNDTLQKHPAFGFKVGLIRLIGNLCWRNKRMQDLARKAEIIPVLLDCSNIDARNPFIMQWVIFAIRNLCENNLKNQQIIAGLHKEGTVSSAMVEEMGLTLHDDDGSGGIRIVPLDLKK